MRTGARHSREFVYDGEEFISIMQLEGLEKHAILIDSLSKRYSATGLRTGALITKNKELRDTALKFCQARLSPPFVGQIAGEAAIDSSKEYMSGVFDEYLSRRNFIVDALNRIPGVFCPTPKGTFYVMAKLPVDDAEKFAMWMLKDFDHKGNTIMLAPGAGFYSPKPERGGGGGPGHSLQDSVGRRGQGGNASGPGSARGAHGR